MEFYDVEAEFYDLFYFDFQDDILLYKKYSKNCKRVLELMCGTGRILYYLDNAKELWGIDSNEKMLQKARENLKGKKAKLIKGDVHDFNLNTHFCLIIIGLNSLTMFPKEDRIKILKNARDHLLPQGKIIVDVFNPFEMVEGIVHHGDTKFIDGKVYSRFFVPIRERERWKLLYFYDIVEGENLRRKVATLYLYPLGLEDIKEEFSQAGLKIMEVYGDYDFSEFDDDRSERIIVVGGRDA